MKIAAVLTIAGTLGIAGTALAHHGKGAHADAGWENKGMQGCETVTFGDARNPGQLFRIIRDSDHAVFGGLNPSQVADEAVNAPNDKVSEYIQFVCAD